MFVSGQASQLIGWKTPSFRVVRSMPMWTHSSCTQSRPKTALSVVSLAEDLSKAWCSLPLRYARSSFTWPRRGNEPIYRPVSNRICVASGLNFPSCGEPWFVCTFVYDITGVCDGDPTAARVPVLIASHSACPTWLASALWPGVWASADPDVAAADAQATNVSSRTRQLPTSAGIARWLRPYARRGAAVCGRGVAVLTAMPRLLFTAVPAACADLICRPPVRRWAT